MTREEHKKAIIENLNAMVDKLEDDNEYFDALYHLDMLFKEIEPCEDCISRRAVLNGLASIAKAKARSDAQKSLMGRVMFFTERLPSVTPQQKRGD